MPPQVYQQVFCQPVAVVNSRLCVVSYRCAFRYHCVSSTSAPVFFNSDERVLSNGSEKEVFYSDYFGIGLRPSAVATDLHDMEQNIRMNPTTSRSLTSRLRPMLLLRCIRRPPFWSSTRLAGRLVWHWEPRGYWKYRAHPFPNPRRWWFLRLGWFARSRTRRKV